MEGLLKRQAGPRTIQRAGSHGEARCEVVVEIDVKLDGDMVRVVAVLGEAKGKAGSLDLANGQNQLFHVFSCFQPSDQAKEIRTKTSCPVIFIEQEGGVLCVSIGVFIGDKFLKDHVACTKLESSTFNVDHMAEQASIWHAIRKAVPELQAEYQRLLDERKDVQVDIPNDKVKINGKWERVRLFVMLTSDLKCNTHLPPPQNPFHLPDFSQVKSVEDQPQPGQPFEAKQVTCWLAQEMLNSQRGLSSRGILDGSNQVNYSATVSTSDKEF